MASNTIKVSVLGDVRDINKKLGNVDKTISGFGKKVSGLGKMVAGAFAGVAVVSAFKDIVKGASDAQQSIGATETVFGKYADTVINTSKKAAGAYGLSANDYRENANLIGSLFKNQGVSLDQLGSKTETMIAKAADLSATFGGDAKTAVEALSSAFKGEFDPLEKYGISLKQSTVNAEAMRLANVDSKKEWDNLSLAQQRAATQQATTNLINKQSAASQGAFAKETGTLAHQQQVLAAKVQNAKDKLGTLFLPILTKVAAYVSDKMLPALEQFAKTLSDRLGPTVQTLGTFLGNLVTWLQQNEAWLKPIAVGIGAIIVAIQVWSAVTKAFTAVQAALNVVMSLNPIGVIILAIIGLIAAIVYLWKTNEGFRKVVLKVWAAIKGGVGAVVNWFKTAVPGAWNYVKAKTSAVWNAIKGFFVGLWNGIKSIVSGAVNGVKNTVSSAWNIIKTGNSTAWNYVKTTISRVWEGIKSAVRTAINSVVSTVRGIKSKVIGVFSSAGSWLLDAGRRILQGLLDGIQRMIGRVKDKLNEVTRLIPDWKGPAKVDKTLLYDAGQLIMEGLINGIDKKTGALKSQLKKVTGIVAGTDVGAVGGGDIALAMDGVAGSRYSGGNTYQITVNAIDPQSASRGVIDAIKVHERNNGTGWRR